MPVVTLSEASIAYELEGTGKGEPLLLIMGIGGQLIQWPPEFKEALIQLGFDLILVDNRDAGLSSSMDHMGIPDTNKAVLQQYLGQPVKGAYSLENMAKDNYELLQHIGIERCHILGISMGSMIAQIFAAKYSQATKSLNLFHSNTGRRRHGLMKPKAFFALSNRGGAQSKEDFIENFVNLFRVVGSPNHQRPESQLRQFANIAYDRGVNPSGFKRQLMAILSTGNRERFFQNIQAPTAIVHGHKDPLMPLSGGRALVREIPNARGYFFKDLGHDLPPIYCETFAQIVRNNADLGKE